MFSEVEADSKIIAVGLQQQGKWTTWEELNDRILQTLDEILEVSRHEADKSSPEPSQRKIHSVRQGDQVPSNTARPWSLMTPGAELNLMADLNQLTGSLGWINQVVHLSVRSIDLAFAVRSSIVHQHDSRRPSTAG